MRPCLLRVLVIFVLAEAFISFVSVEIGRTQVAKKPIIPLAPAELLKYLPATPTGWKLRQSTAKNFFVEWICSQATREFERVVPPNEQTGGLAPPAQITVVKLVDTGYFPAFNGPFENFRVGKFGAFESLVINGMQARRSKLAADRETLQVSLRGRFIVSVELKNQPPANEQAWLNTFDFKRISAIPDSGSEQLPKPITINVVDELSPSKSSTSTVYWGGPKSPADRSATDQ